MAERIVRKTDEKVVSAVKDDHISLSSGGTEVLINLKNGLIAGASRDGRSSNFTDGPRFVGISSVPSEVRHYESPDGYVVEALYPGRSGGSVKWTMLPGGWLRLDYGYRPAGLQDLLGITFSFSEETVKDAFLMANGPYRVWKNRLKGPLFGVYHKEYNNTVTGESWDYPEFKGYYSNFYAVRIGTADLPLTIVSAADDIYLHLFTPQNPGHASGWVTPEFPEGNISLLNSISPIGTKFNPPESLGPGSQKNSYREAKPLGGTIYFRFGD